MSTENQITDQADAKKIVRGHGIPFPTINLERVVELAAKVWESEKRNAASVSAVLSHWGYGLKSSGGFQAIASMKRFGILEEQGSGERRTVKLTQLALDLLKSSTIDLKEYSRLLKEAALYPKAHKELWSKYGTELPSDQTLKSYLEFDRNFSEDAAKQFIKVYKDTISFAKLTSGDTLEEADEENIPKADTNSGSELGSQKNTSPLSNLPVVNPPAAPKAHFASPIPNLNPTVKYFAIPTDIGDAMIPMGMSDEDFNLFEGALKLFKTKIVKASRYPIGAIWKNNDFDKPVTIIGEMGDHDGVKFYQSQDGTGIPESELTFA